MIPCDTPGRGDYIKERLDDRGNVDRWDRLGARTPWFYPLCELAHIHGGSTVEPGFGRGVPVAEALPLGHRDPHGQMRRTTLTPLLNSPTFHTTPEKGHLTSME
ncbi:hypothetical protein AVEN_200268-1 [Araneus ventricosus]|uniref:Uncharacterized protein n=1 Tax=Araneus ventricosus TaxID=182803 RepID=A0A4Y2DTH1_ARAVE|nr:hypothetical protein AVEN_200268-1 [Araneus ventricosus]